MAFENTDLSMNNQAISNRFYASDVKLFGPLWRHSLRLIEPLNYFETHY